MCVSQTWILLYCGYTGMYILIVISFFINCGNNEKVRRIVLVKYVEVSVR